MSRPRFDHEHSVQAPSSIPDDDPRSTACRMRVHRHCRIKTCPCDCHEESS